MPIIASISGIRGTLGDDPQENLTSQAVTKFATAFGKFIKQPSVEFSLVKIVIGRDGRESGLMIRDLVVTALNNLGIDVVDLGLAATPTVELAVIWESAQGGIIISASHNPANWNALKLLNAQGEFLSATDGQKVLDLASWEEKITAPEKLGTVSYESTYATKHIAEILKLPLVKPDLIKAANFKIVVDGINSVGGIVIPELLQALGVKNIIPVNCEPTGHFAHAPEPLPANLIATAQIVKDQNADLGLVVDPDVDRLLFIDERGEVFGEEYTLVAVADYVFKNFSEGDYKKVAVSNLSSSRALKDVAQKYGGEYFATPVGEINVVDKMKETGAIIGGEGNGGVIFPELHCGRDALVGTALFLSALASGPQKLSEYRQKFPNYFLIKDKLELSPNIKPKIILEELQKIYQDENLNTIDGLKIDRPDSWVHIRVSNTEPIMRIYAEAKSELAAQELAEEIKSQVKKLLI